MWLIVYGSATETSVGKLFLAGVPAGILLLLIYLLITKVLVTANPKLAPVSPKATWKERWHALRSGGLIEVIIVFALSMGGMFIGWFTPTEAGAVGAAGMLLVTVIQKKMNWKKLKLAMKDTVRLTGMIYLILAVRRYTADFSQSRQYLSRWATLFAGSICRAGACCW
jgi:TRAP-type C4-dicarboxylate transport system permease large subunit